jgi:hypothetical protein
MCAPIKVNRYFGEKYVFIIKVEGKAKQETNMKQIMLVACFMRFLV